MDAYKYARHSAAEFFTHWLENKVIKLKKLYRYHPSMVPTIGYAVYENDVQSGFGPNHPRIMVREMKIPVISNQITIFLLHAKGPEEKARGTSLANQSQEDLAGYVMQMLNMRTPQ